MEPDHGTKKKQAGRRAWEKAARLLCDRQGSGMVEFVILIVIALVIGALILVTMTDLWEQTILPAMQEKVTQMFDYRTVSP
ncbi:MAG: DUF6133 family protein [Clostridium sp.]|jgi:hypothetical protein|nr:DUF6133 family protein [Clostridium sp.]